jgi:micrococcal nuclease
VLWRLLPWFIAAALAAGWLVTRRRSDEGTDAAPVSARVVRVVDGDTVRARLAGGRLEAVRYIGVDTPEDVRPGTPVQCFSLRAAARNRALVGGRRVRLSFDRERRDRYGRLLAYVRRRPDGLFVNARLVAEGYARDVVYAPNTAHAELFRTLAARARRARRGLWSHC